jgi:radical SAM superfamily enzyme YgiQ (UPF0313 family)
MKQKILLLEPNEGVWAPGKYLRHSSVEPLGLEYIGAEVQQDGHEVRIVQQRDMTDRQLLKKVKEYSPGIVGFTVMTYNFNAAEHLARQIKKLNPNIKIVFGGAHPTAMPEIVSNWDIDYVVIGEGEKTFRELVRTISNKGDLDNVDGIAYWDHDIMSMPLHTLTSGIRIKPPRGRITNLDSVPWPIRKKEILEECKIFGFNNPPLSKQKMVSQVLFSRGCPYDCIFCCSPRMWGNKVVSRSPKDVVGEIKFLESEFGTNYVYFADLLFNCSKKKVIELCKEMIKRKISSKWFCLCSVKNMDKDIADAMSEAGCTRIGFGVDAVTNDVLKTIKPRQKSTFTLAEKALSLCDSVGIINRAFIIIGYPWQSMRALENTGKKLHRLPIDDLRIGLLTPLPGSPIYDEFKKNNMILVDNFSRFSTEECVIKLTHMTSNELLGARNKIFKGFYESKEYAVRMENKIKRFPALAESYKEHVEFLSTLAVNVKKYKD